MTLEESLIEFYNNVKGNHWPDVNDFLAMPDKPHDIVKEIVASYQLPDGYDSHDRIEILCELLQLDQIPDDIADYVMPDPFVALYQSLQQPTWPDVNDFLDMPDKPHDIVKEIVASYQLPDGYDSHDRIELLCELLQLDQIPDDIISYVMPDPFVALYQSLQQHTWPDVNDFLAMPNKPYDIVEEIVATCKQTPEYNYIVDQFNTQNTTISVEHAKVKMHNYFFWSTVDFYKQQPEIFKLLHHTTPKEKYFDVLLGRRKYHRDLIYQHIDHEKNYVTYMTPDESVNLAACNHMNFVWPTEILPADVEITNTASIVKVNGIIVSLSQIIPVSIYNQTAYSLVSESQCENNFSFFTEKIIKPMLARRLFVVSSGRFYLKNLRSMGFKTFDGIIDESYDNEYRLHVRTDMLLEQIKYLYQCDQQHIYLQCQAILDHNFELLMNTDWQKDMIQQISNDLTQFAHN